MIPRCTRKRFRSAPPLRTPALLRIASCFVWTSRKDTSPVEYKYSPETDFPALGIILPYMNLDLKLKLDYNGEIGREGKKDEEDI